MVHPFDPDGLDAAARFRVILQLLFSTTDRLDKLKLLDELASVGDSPATRTVVASFEECSDGILSRLSDDDFWEVRYLVACNKSTKEDLLNKLSADDNEQVATAANKRLLDL